MQEDAAPSSATGGFRPYKGNTTSNAAISSEMKASAEGSFPEVTFMPKDAQVFLPRDIHHHFSFYRFCSYCR